MGADGYLNIVPCEEVKDEDPDLYDSMVEEWPESDTVILGKNVGTGTSTLMKTNIHLV